ncbi:hypothetical protein ICE98_01257 [Lactococcus lactis]|nr:hypothetical protein [Lactococcus lactis]
MEIIEKQNLFELLSDNGEVIGEMAYMPMNNSIIITHTGVSLDYRGQGLAEKLVLAGIEKARHENINWVQLAPMQPSILENIKKNLLIF